jgi:hydroxyethylthiazole kinase-like uncharacterized protein yjeF
VDLVTAKEMREMDRLTIDEIGIPAAVLMENAGRALADAVLLIHNGKPLSDMDGEMVPGSAQASAAPEADAPNGKPWAILIGKGNNGGDGLVAARHLQARGLPVRLIYASDPQRLEGEAALQHSIAARLGIPAEVYRPEATDWKAMGGIIDALLGTGSHGTPREPYASLIREANASGLPIVAADIPSGLDADTGNAADPCIKAVATVTFAFAKRGLAQFPGAAQSGTVVVAAIGIPAALAEANGVRTRMVTPRLLRERLHADPNQQRETDSHKGTYGHVLVAAGTRPMSGAGLLSSTAALRAGSGLVTWAVPDRMLDSLIGVRPELMLAAVPDGGTGDWSATDPLALAKLAETRDALVIGPGFGRIPQKLDAPEARGWLRRLWDALPPELPLVVDADALNHLAEAGDFAAWPKRPGTAVLTPHPGEMARLAGIPTREVQRDRIGIARAFAVKHGVILVLKGARTVVATPNGDVYVNPTGNPGMATGGTGDVLAGIIGSHLAQQNDPVAAAVLGVYLHGLAGDRAAAKRATVASLIAGDLINEL